MFLRSEEVDLSERADRRLRRAGTDQAPGHSISDVVARRYHTSETIVGYVQFNDFETTDRYSRFRVVECHKSKRKWNCLPPVDGLELTADQLPDQLAVDPQIPTATVLALLEYLRTEPSLDQDEQQRVKVEDLKYVTEVTLNVDGDFEVRTRESPSFGFLIIVGRRDGQLDGDPFFLKGVMPWIA
jgi:hypothetical protein